MKATIQEILEVETPTYFYFDFAIDWDLNIIEGGDGNIKAFLYPVVNGFTITHEDKEIFIC